jgi:hypothetical protein
MAEFNLQGFQPYDIQQQRIGLSTPSQVILDSRERTRKAIDKHNMFTRGFALLTGTSPGARVEYPTYGTSSKSQSAAIEKQINIDFMQAVDKIYKERGRLTEDELMTIGRAYNAGPAQYRLLKEMMPFIGKNREEVAEQEEAASQGRVSDIVNKVLSNHRYLVVEADPEFVANRIGEAVFDVDSSNLSDAEKNAARKEVVDRLQKAANISKTGREEVRAEIGEEHRIADRTQRINEAAREASKNKTVQLLVYEALKEINAANTAATYVTKDGAVAPMTPGLTTQRKQEILAKYAKRAHIAGVDIEEVQDGITSGIVKAPSTKHVIDTHAQDPDQKHVFRTDNEIRIANAGPGPNRYIPVYDGDKLSLTFKTAAMAVLRKVKMPYQVGETTHYRSMDTLEGIELLQFINKVGPLNAAAQRPRYSKLIFDILEEMEKDKNAWLQLLEGNFKGGSPSELRVRVRNGT